MLGKKNKGEIKRANLAYALYTGNVLTICTSKNILIVSGRFPETLGAFDRRDKNH